VERETRGAAIHTMAETVGSLAKEFKLTEPEQEELLPSGSETVFTNRVRWARTFLKKAGLIDATGRGRFRISQRGIEVVKDKPGGIDNRFLSQFAEFQDAIAHNPRDSGKNRPHRTVCAVKIISSDPRSSSAPV